MLSKYYFYLQSVDNIYTSNYKQPLNFFNG